MKRHRKCFLHFDRLNHAVPLIPQRECGIDRDGTPLRDYRTGTRCPELVRRTETPRSGEVIRILRHWTPSRSGFEQATATGEIHSIHQPKGNASIAVLPEYVALAVSIEVGDLIHAPTSSWTVQY